jgi:hypothetical protein
MDALATDPIDQDAERLSPGLAALYARMDPPLAAFTPGPDYTDALAVTRYIWMAGGYRCGITVHINFFLMSPGFVSRAAAARPARFGRLLAFARSFDFTDVFIKRVTASGRGAAAGEGLESPAVQRMLRGIQRAHDALTIPHWEMVHFGYRLMQHLEDDLGGLGPRARQLHLHYMAQAYRIMGIPFSEDRALLETFCLELERERARMTPQSAAYTRRLIFLGLIVGVPDDRASLARLLPAPQRALFEAHYAELRPGLGARLLGRVLNLLHYPRRRWRNPRPGPAEREALRRVEA